MIFFNRFILACLFFFSCQLPWTLYGQVDQSVGGRVLFFIQQGHHKEAIELYQQQYQELKQHDYALLRKMGLSLLKEGSQQQDGEVALLTLLGASIAADKEAFPILLESLKSRYREIQLLGLKALAKIQEDRADEAITKALGSRELLVRLEALKILCEKSHPLALEQAESLMIKSPRVLMPVYPELIAKINDPIAKKKIRRFLDDPSADVRLHSILAIAKTGDRDFLSLVLLKARHSHYQEQEAAAFTLGVMKDERALNVLKKLSRSQFPMVTLAALQALLEFQDSKALSTIEEMAKSEDIYAIALLGKNCNATSTLKQLLLAEDYQVKVNAAIALLQQQDGACIPVIKELLIDNNKDMALSRKKSPGKTLTAWHVTLGASAKLKNDENALIEHLFLRETLLKEVRYISEEHFLDVCELVLEKQQSDLIPTVIEELVDMNRPKGKELLLAYQQKLGAPFVRNYCNLALYRLEKTGPYGNLLKEWLRGQTNSEIIQIRNSIYSWEGTTSSFDLTPRETSKLLIDTFLTFVELQDQEGISILLEHIATGQPKNKYALAGILLQTVQ